MFVPHRYCESVNPVVWLGIPAVFLTDGFLKEYQVGGHFHKYVSKISPFGYVYLWVTEDQTP